MQKGHVQDLFSSGMLGSKVVVIVEPTELLQVIIATTIA